MIYLTLLAALFVSFAENTPLDSRIINGVDAPNTPWVARIIFKYEPSRFGIAIGSLCGGSLVAPNWVLTAAHCILFDNNTLSSENYWVSVGNVNYFYGQIIKVSKHYIHPDYKNILNGKTTADLALLKLESYVQNITPVHVELENNLDYSGRLATVYGWGTTEIGVNTGVTNLQTTDVEIFDGYNCQENWICINPESTNSYTCGGDSGGPIVIEESYKTTLIGVTSFGRDDCSGDRTVFTRTSYYGDWIKATIADN